MKIIGKIGLFLTTLILLSCDSIFLKPRELENEFKNYVSDSDSVLFDGDNLHPTYAFIKSGKIIGLEFTANPECGSYKKRFFLDENESITKVVIEKDFWSEHCGEPFDSIYVIDIPSDEVKVFTKSTDGKIIKNMNIDDELIDVEKYKRDLKNWHYR